MINANTKLLTIKKYVSTLESVMRSGGQDTLGSVLSRVRSSHEAVFVFDNNKEFIGLISPFKTLYSSNFPYTTKVSSIAFKAPAITEKTPVYQVVEYMLSTKMYTLPVLSKEGVLKNVIHGKDIQQEIIKDPDLLKFVSERIKTHTPITAPINSSVKEVFHKLKAKGVSRIILVDDEGVLAGIVTRGDLMHSKIKPTTKMRFSKEGTRGGLNSFAGEKEFRKSEPVRKYHTTLVDSLLADTPRSEIVKHLVASPHDSVVLVNKHGKPTGFLSTRDILQALALLRPEEDVPLSIKRPSASVSNGELEQATKHLEVFGKKLRVRMEIEKIEVASEEPKSSEGKTKIFNTTVIVTPVAGKSFIAVTKERNYIDGIQKSTKLIEKQLKRSGLSRKETAKS